MKAVSNFITNLVFALLVRKGLGVAQTDPPSGSVIADFEGTANVTTLVCNVTEPTNERGITVWSVQNFRGGSGVAGLLLTTAPELFGFGGDPIPSAPNFTYLNRLTIRQLTSELDEVVLYCGTGRNTQQANFLLRIYRPPVLMDNFTVSVVENSRNFPIDISQEPTAFPTDTVSFEWTRGIQPLIVGPGLNLTYSTVTFSNIDRHDSGNYFVFASNVVEDREVGNDTGSFNLNVIYAPTFTTEGPHQRYVLLNDSLSLVCGTGLDSNPQANVTWMAPNGTTIMDNAKYDLENGPEIVRLNFTQTSPNDNGIWRCRVFTESDQYVVSGGQLIQQDSDIIGEVIVDIQLTIIAPPGQPHTLLVKESEATLFQVCWEAPPVQSDSHISYYLLRACSLNSSVDSDKVTTTTISNETFYSVTGLLPGTTYELTVVAVSQGGDVVARSQPSDSIVDTTGVSVPELFCNASVSSDSSGTVTVTWSYVHTGGLPLTNVSVSYTNDNNLSPIPIPLISVDTTSVTIPDLKAGFEYTFNVTAENSEGSSSTVCGLTTPKLVLLGSNPSLIAAIVGGVVGGLVVILLTLLGFGIAAVTLGLKKRGNQIKLEAVYEDPDNLQQYTPKKDIKLEECPAYVEKKKGEIELEECPAYGQAKKDEDIKLEECPAYVERKDDIKLEECPAYGQYSVQERPG